MALTQSQVQGLNNMCANARNAKLGDIVGGFMGGGYGTVYYLDPTNGLDSNDGRSKYTAFKTLPVAYDALTAGQNDVLVYMAGTSSISLSSAFTWAKSYTHFIGASSPVTVANRARIFQASTATGVGTLFTVSASGCIFENLYFFHGVNDATSLVCFKVTGQRNHFENVHFAGIGHATMDTTGAASLKLDGAAENVFKNCAIGLDTINGGANSTELWCINNATRNHFVDCQIYRYLGNAGHALVTVGATGIDRWLRFTRCLFYTDSVNQTITLTSAFSLTAMTQGKIILDGGTALITDGASGSGDWDSNNRGLIWNASVAPAAAAAGGILTKQ